MCCLAICNGKVALVALSSVTPLPFFCSAHPPYHTCYGRNGSRFSSTGRAFLTIGEKGGNGKAEHRWDRATLGRAWFLFPMSWFLGF